MADGLGRSRTADFYLVEVVTCNVIDFNILCLIVKQCDMTMFNCFTDLLNISNYKTYYVITTSKQVFTRLNISDVVKRKKALYSINERGLII